MLLYVNLFIITNVIITKNIREKYSGSGKNQGKIREVENEILVGTLSYVFVMCGNSIEPLYTLSARKIPGSETA